MRMSEVTVLGVVPTAWLTVFQSATFRGVFAVPRVWKVTAVASSCPKRGGNAVAPVAPVTAAPPAAPVAPVTPAPVAPAGPAAPVAPVTPAPVAPAAPAAPVAPCAP